MVPAFALHAGVLPLLREPRHPPRRLLARAAAPGHARALCAGKAHHAVQAAAPGAAVARRLPPLLQGHGSRLGAPHHSAPLVPPLPDR